MSLVITLERKLYTGKALLIRSTFKNDLKNPISVTGATLKIKLPSGATNTFTGGSLTSVSQGVFTYSFTPTLAGRHFIRWESTSPAISEESDFNVETTRV